MEAIRDRYIEKQLVDRREKLDQALSHSPDNEQLVNLLRDVDAALERMGSGSYGICEACHDPIESDRLLLNPLIRNCLDHLSAGEQRTLERDLDLAYQIQRALLPGQGTRIDGWDFSYHYEPAGPVSGDYCDVIVPRGDGGSFYFLIGDVSGKGVAASMLMAHLHATFRSLVGAGISPGELVERANRIFSEGTLPSHFATLVCGRVDSSNEVQICNAGHCPPIQIRSGRVTPLQSNGLPLGLFCDGGYSSERVKMLPGDGFVLYTDGISESQDSKSDQYGEERIMEHLKAKNTLAPAEVIKATLEDVRRFRNGGKQHDDITMMVLRRRT